jgi:hypothetical protein
MSSSGLPPMLKNSNPCPSTKLLNTACVAMRTRWPKSFNVHPSATNGWTSPLDPTICITIFNGGGGGPYDCSGSEVVLSVSSKSGIYLRASLSLISWRLELKRLASRRLLFRTSRLNRPSSRDYIVSFAAAVNFCDPRPLMLVLVVKID